MYTNRSIYSKLQDRLHFRFDVLVRGMLPVGSRCRIWRSRHVINRTDNNNNIMKLSKIAGKRKHPALEGRCHPFCQVKLDTVSVLHIRWCQFQITPQRDQAYGVHHHHHHHHHRLGAIQGPGPDSSFQNKPNHWDNCTCAILLGTWDITDDPIFQCRFCFLGYHGPLLLGRTCLQTGLVCVGTYPVLDQVAFPAYDENG